MSAVPLFDVTVTRAGREEHVLRLGEDEHVRQDDAAGEPTDTVTRKLTGLVGLHLGGLDLDPRSVTVTETIYTPEARRRERGERLLNYVRQAEALGIDVVNILSDLLLAEDHVRAFEQRTGRALKRFVPTQGASALLTPEDWKALAYLAEIIRAVPRALSCWRVLTTLEWLRSARSERAVRDLPPELTPLLDEIGKKIARPSRWWNREQLEKQREILNVWEARSSLNRDEREATAVALGLGPLNAWKTLAREARRLIAGNRREHENWVRRWRGDDTPR